MKLTFLGAAHEVTGSCMRLEACGKNILIDCGMEQGPDEYENQEIPENLAGLDCVLLTHAHIDHSGRLPLLCKNGFSGRIHTTQATADLCDIMLRDSAHIQEFEAEWRNRKGKRAGENAVEPMYSMADAVNAVSKIVVCDYNTKKVIYPGIEIQFIDAGHLLGSASIEVWIKENNTEKKIVFSGDIGNPDQPILKNPTYLTQADYVVMESTYGDREHGQSPDYIKELSSIMQRTFDRGGNVVIPSFAVGRTQEMLYFLRKIKADRLIKGHDDYKVYVDSPLAIEATNIFKENMLDCYDEETMALVRSGVNPIGFDGLVTTTTSEESKLINSDTSCKVILSASGMCEAGRIKHHLKHNLWRAESTILFVGYQAQGTLGRILLDGVKSVKLFGEKISVKAEIQRLEGVSSHSDASGLIKWAKAYSPLPTRFFVEHGDDGVCDTFADRLRKELGASVEAPYPDECWDLTEDVCVVQGNRQHIQTVKSDAEKQIPPDFKELINASKRLEEVIAHNKGGANKDLTRLAEQINSLADMWDR